MKNMKIRVPMIILAICLELAFIIGLIVNINIYGSEHLYSSGMGIFAIINLIIIVCAFIKKKKSRGLDIVVGLYILISIFLPAYGFIRDYAPTGKNSNVMGLATERIVKNMYGFTIKEKR